MTLVTSVLGIALPIGAITMISFTDVVIVQHVFSRHVSGLYGASALVGRAISAIVGFVFVVLLPKVASRAAVGLSTTRLLLAAVVAAGGILGIALSLTALFPAFLVTLLAGKAFTEAGAFVFPYAIAMSAIGLASVLATYLIALGRVWFGIPLACAAGLEVLALSTYHANIWTVLYIVIIGHMAVLVCCVTDVVITLLSGSRRIRIANLPRQAMEW